MTFDKQTKSIYINGEWKSIDSSKTEKSYNPATLEPITEVAYGGAGETKQAIEAADAAFTPWSSLTGRDRKSTRLNSSHLSISYAVFCLLKKAHHTTNISS